MPSDSAPDDQADDPHAAKGPLAGIRVLELATVLMGPLGSQLLGDLGAEIIKVEGSKLDSSRVMGGGPHRELSGIALNIHRNKRSISLDLKTQRGKEIFLKLLAGSDVLITNLRPGPLARLGFDYESKSLSARKMETTKWKKRNEADPSGRIREMTVVREMNKFQ